MNEAQQSVAASQATDVSSTAMALGLGFTEANPLGVALIPAKALLIKHASCETRDGVNYVTYAASGWNIAMIAGAGGFIGVPVAILLYSKYKNKCPTMKDRVADAMAIYYGIPD